MINSKSEKITTSGKEKNVVSKINESPRKNNKIFLRFIKNYLS
jgi:hypothetical protein